MYISLGSLKDADALTAKMKELIIFPLPTIVLMFLPLFIQITELFHLINAACEGTAERLRSRKCTSTSKHKIQSPPPHQHHRRRRRRRHATPKQTSTRSSGAFIIAVSGLTSRSVLVLQS